MFAMHEVHSTNGESNARYTEQISGVIIETFTVDATSDVIYFIDSGSNTLKKYDIISQETSNLTSLTSAKGDTHVKIMLLKLNYAITNVLIYKKKKLKYYAFLYFFLFYNYEISFHV